MKRIKLLFGSALALVLALSLFVPATVSAEETGDVTVTPTADTTYAPTTADTLDQDAFDAKYPDGAKQGEILNLEDYYDGDVSQLVVWNVSTTGNVFWYEGDTEYSIKNGEIWLYQPGTVTITFIDLTDLSTYYTLEVTIVENPVDVVLVPTEVTIAPNESTTVLIDTVPENAWWFWLELEEAGTNGIMIETTISDTSVISVEKAYNEDNEWIGYTITGLKEGTATLSIETELGHVSETTVTVKKPTPVPTTPPTTTTTTPSTKPAVAANNGGPATGDATNTTMYMLMMLAALASVSGYTFLKKQK